MNNVLLFVGCWSLGTSLVARVSAKMLRLFSLAPLTKENETRSIGHAFGKKLAEALRRQCPNTYPRRMQIPR